MVPVSESGDFNARILRQIRAMPDGGRYAAVRVGAAGEDRFRDLYEAIEGLDAALRVDRRGRLKVDVGNAMPASFCSSASYLLFCKVISELQSEGVVVSDVRLSGALADLGCPEDVIHGRLDGVGLFGMWNADGPGTAVLFRRLGLGRSSIGFEEAAPGDFLKLFWNDKIGKGERGHLVVYLGTNSTGDAIEVWSSNLRNDDGSSGYGRMWVPKSRIHRALFSRLEHPERLALWLELPEAAKTSDYLVRIRQAPSTTSELRGELGL